MKNTRPDLCFWPSMRKLVVLRLKLFPTWCAVRFRATWYRLLIVCCNPRNESITIMRSEYAISDRRKHPFEYPIAKIVHPILAQNPTTRVIRFSCRKMAGPLNSRCCPRQQAAAKRSMSRMVTQLYSDVASRPTRGRQAARLSLARLQSDGAART